MYNNKRPVGVDSKIGRLDNFISLFRFSLRVVYIKVKKWIISANHNLECGASWNNYFWNSNLILSGWILSYHVEYLDLILLSHLISDDPPTESILTDFRQNSDMVSGDVNKYINIKFRGTHSIKDHPHPDLSFVQGLASDGNCTRCDMELQYELIFKCSQCMFAIHCDCCKALSSYGDEDEDFDDDELSNSNSD
nr:zinc finger, PHD-type [Tanacetum cinerariifolium]